MKSPIEALMAEFKAPMTRDEFIKWNNMGKSAKISSEEEAELPKRFAYPIVSHEVLKPKKEAKGKGTAGAGAPADFPGPVLPNPKGIVPKLDTDNPDVAPGGPQMDTSNPPKNQRELDPNVPREQ